MRGDNTMANATPLLPLVRRFFETDSVAAARTLDGMDHDDALSVLKALPSTLAAQAFGHLQALQGATLLKDAPPSLFKEIVEKLGAEQGAGIFAALPESHRQKFLGQLSSKAKRDIQELLTFPEGSAGRLMAKDFVAFHTGIKVREAIQRMRQLAGRKALSSYTYVIDSENHLVGVINMRDLILARGDAELESIMRTQVFSVDSFMDREDVARQLTQHGYFAAPVVDSDGRLLGVVKSDRLIGQVQEKATEDMQRMFGAGDERTNSPISYALRKRLLWLNINLGTAFLAASVVAIFEGIIAKITVLAVFLPVVAGQGGNAGIQTLAVVMRGLVMREIKPGQFRRLLGREAILGFVNGAAIGVVTGLVAWVWHGNPFLGIVIGVAMIIGMVVAGLAGAAIPLTMKALGLDPAQSSGIILTTVTDVVGFFAFLGLAMLFQGYLM
jgi:magnesium transporter